MITREEYESAKRQAVELLARSGIVLRPEETEQVEVLDFGLGEIQQTGLQVLSIVETDAIGVRVLALLPGQTCPEHRHPPLGKYPGKEETFRCAWGEVYVCMCGPRTAAPRARAPAHRSQHFTVWSETVLRPGDQVTSPPDTCHWFQAGPEGAVVWLFCSRVTDAEDVFTDPEVRRMAPVLGDDGQAEA
ncbi:MAG: D-lyxose/D-mannose family sugar isomerase [Planctomycetota bacterium]